MDTPLSKQTDSRFPPEVIHILQRAGWYEGRVLADSELEKWYAFEYECIPGHHHIIPSALAVLREFGGLYVEQEIPGVTCYRHSFWIDPFMTLGLQEENWSIYEWLVEESLFPLGVTGNSRDDVLFITSSGKVLCVSYDGDRPLLLEGNTFDDALITLIIGLMPSRMRFEDYERKRNEATQVSAAMQRLYFAR